MRALIALALLVVLSACQDFHWVTPQPHPTRIAPRVAPPTVSLMPTITPDAKEE